MTVVESDNTLHGPLCACERCMARRAKDLALGWPAEEIARYNERRAEVNRSQMRQTASGQ